MAHGASSDNPTSAPIEHLDVAHLITEVETAWIPMADGRQLAARLFLPRTADEHPVPVILEYIPYRRRDGTRLGYEGMHRWFAANGYASVRVDIDNTYFAPTDHGRTGIIHRKDLVTTPPPRRGPTSSRWRPSTRARWPCSTTRAA